MAKEVFVDEKSIIDKLFFLQGDNIKVEGKRIGIFYSAGSTVGNEATIYNLAKSVKSGVINKGFTPNLIPVKTTHPLYLYANKKENFAPVEINSIINFVEVTQSLHNFDGFVFIPMGENAINAFMQVAIKLNMPTLFVGTGCNLPNFVDGRLFTQGSIFELVAEHNLNMLDDKQYKKQINNFMPTLCEGEGLTYGNGLNIAMEVLAVALRGNGTILSDCQERYNLAFKTGETICDLIEDQLVIRKILSKANFLNSEAVLMSLGFNIRPIQIVANWSVSAGSPITENTLSDLSNSTPLIASIYPNGKNYVNELHTAGGVNAILKSLQMVGAFNNRGTNTFAENIEAEISKAVVLNEEIIRNAKTNAILSKKPICLVSGNIAEQGGAINRAGIFRNLNGFSGYAKVFDTEEEACHSVYASRIKQGDVVVVKNQGNLPTPGLFTINELQAAINVSGLSKDVAIVTDGVASPYFANIIVSNVKKPTHLGEGIALVYDDDIIDIDIEDNKVNAKITAKDMSTRRRNFMPYNKRDTVEPYEKYLK